MAHSIHIKPEFWDDPRYIELKIIVGEQKAIWSCITAWRIAFGYWRDQSRLIPEKVWKGLRLPDALIHAGFAMRKDNGVYVRGTKERVENYQTVCNRNSLAGQKSAARKSNKIIESSQRAVDKSLTDLDLDLDSRKEIKEEEEEIRPIIFQNQASQEPVTHPIPADWKARCLPNWQATLDRFEILKSAKMDEADIARLIQRFGIEKTELALLGAGFEASFEGYDPADYCRISRLKDPNKFDLYVNLALKNQPKVWGKESDAVPIS